ncbi:hypothetical protein PHYSODRAFT_323584 [Phytophthora sojae]|uniref:MULE transposase domain-containing protein n=1 Tax=Phytophthora sojae (strain P6497) TaxID=1094619 RepID=G4YJP0_PHYSP|nr:hypothetical protein PHYSODRAFT_323584 [Phytophthora sojae]EGZ30152.1 hypothetical protein PHYSODRAFT_323584 [Phytophthora sojae]|eukprot:XP_009517427.1 hypothetical protein PHYSODRAFT_323584 [Phytophthora sojae]
MAPRKPWSEIAVYVTEAEGIDILENMKSYQIHRSDPVMCTICAYSGDQDMRYPLLKFVSTTCALALSQACPWRGNLLVCLKTRRTTILEQEEHFSQASSPKRLKLSSAQKQFCRELTEERLRPMRIRHALSRQFGVALDLLPSLTTVQNYVNNYSRSMLNNHDRVDDIRKWIGDRAYTGEEPMTQPFTFSWEIDMHGRPLVGDGSDENPFLVGISSKAMMFRLAAPPDSFILHIDATYKLNRLEYPVVVVGISDQSRGFHLVALFIVSQEVQEIYESALRALDRLFTWITGQKLVVYFSMVDADQAQYNALNAVFGTNAQFKCLMCFFTS